MRNEKLFKIISFFANKFKKTFLYNNQMSFVLHNANNMFRGIKRSLPEEEEEEEDEPPDEVRLWEDGFKECYI